MQFSSKIVLLLTAAATGVFASPAVNARDVAACQTVQDGDFTYVGSADVSPSYTRHPVTIMTMLTFPSHRLRSNADPRVSRRDATALSRSSTRAALRASASVSARTAAILAKAVVRSASLAPTRECAGRNR